MDTTNVMLVTGAGQISMAIARRMGAGMTIVMGNKNPTNAQSIASLGVHIRRPFK